MNVGNIDTTASNLAKELTGVSVLSPVTMIRHHRNSNMSKFVRVCDVSFMTVEPVKVSGCSRY
jgi:hypothetical protein